MLIHDIHISHVNSSSESHNFFLETNAYYREISELWEGKKYCVLPNSTIIVDFKVRNTFCNVVSLKRIGINFFWTSWNQINFFQQKGLLVSRPIVLTNELCNLSVGSFFLLLKYEGITNFMWANKSERSDMMEKIKIDAKARNAWHRFFENA